MSVPIEVQGLCPMGCGRTLVVAPGGHVICSLIACPNPSRAGFEMSLPLHLRPNMKKMHEAIMSQAARIKELEGASTDRDLVSQIEERRGDTEFMARAAWLMIEHKTILDRLAEEGD